MSSAWADWAESMQLLKSLAGHSLVFGASELIKKGIGLLMIPVYTRYLLPADYGLLELLELAVSVLALIFGMRIGAAIIRFHHRYDRLEDRQEVYTTALIAIAFLSIIGLAALLFCSGTIARQLGGDEAQVGIWRLMFVCLALQQIFLTGENFLLAQKKSLTYAYLSIVMLIIMLTLNILFLVFMGMGLEGIVLSMLIAKLVNMLLVLLITLQGVKLRFSMVKLVEMIRYSLPLVPAGMAMFLLHFSDRFLVNSLCNLEELGIYSLGYKFGMVISVLVTAPFFKIWDTQRFEIAGQSDGAAVFARVFTWFSLVLVLVGLSISLFVDEVIRWLTTSGYHGASSVVPVIAAAYVVFSMASFLNLGNMITGRTKPLMYIQILVAVVNLLLNLMLIGRFGIMGAAVSTLLSFLLLAALNLAASQRVLAVPFEYGRVAALLLIAIVLFYLSRTLQGPFVLVLTGKVLLLVAFPLLLLLTRFFGHDEVDGMRRMVRGFFSRLSPVARS